MSEKQAKRLRQLEVHEARQDAALDALDARMTACEASGNVFQRCELEAKDAALEAARQKLRRSQKRARVLEETVWTWKAAAAAALASTVLTIILSILL